MRLYNQPEMLTASMAESAEFVAKTPGPGHEFDLLCLLTAAEPGPHREQEIANWNPAQVNWQELVRLAEHHGVLPLAARNLTKYGHAIPPEIERSLRSSYESNLKRSLWFTAEMLRITRHFEANRLRAIPFKGAALAQSLYGDPGLRSYSDLDFLISPADFNRAAHLLAEIGYRPSTSQHPAVERLWLRVGYERSFDSAAGKNLLELQWALQPHFYAVDLPVEDLLARAGRALVEGCELPCLNSEDLLIVLCLHAAKHLWTRLIWLSDIAETLRTQTIDFSTVLSRARSLGIIRILGVSFWLVKNVLQVEIPTSAEEIIATDPQVPMIGREFSQRLARGAVYDFESTEYFRLILKLRERRIHRSRYLWRLVWTPGSGDVSAVPLPEALFPLYRIVRLGRLTQKLFRSPQ